MRNLLFLASFLMIVSLGCAKRQAVQEEEPIEESIIFEEAEDTTGFGDIMFEEEAEEDTAEEISLFEEEDIPEVEEDTITEIVEEETTEPATRQGYRVQIGAYEKKSRADKVASMARNRLQENVYVEYIAPFYKVRAGDFTTRAKADQYKRNLISMGYKDAFLVETTIKME